MERAIRLATRRGLPGDLDRWRTARDAIYRRIMDRGWSPRLDAFTQYEGGDVLDAAVLLMPLVKFIAPTDPKWLSTLDALTASLVSDSLVYPVRPAGKPGRAARPGRHLLGVLVLVRGGARPRRAPGGGAARVREDAHLRQPPGPVRRADQPHRGAARKLPPALTHLALISAAFNLDRALG